MKIFGLLFLIIIPTLSYSNMRYECSIGVFKSGLLDLRQQYYLNESVIIQPNGSVQHKPIELYAHDCIGEVGKPTKCTKKDKKISNLEIWHRNSKKYGLYVMIREGRKHPLIDGATDHNASKIDVSSMTYPHTSIIIKMDRANLACKGLDK